MIVGALSTRSQNFLGKIAVQCSPYREVPEQRQRKGSVIFPLVSYPASVDQEELQLGALPGSVEILL